MKRVRILLADDHTEMLKRVTHLLQSEFEVVGAVNDGQTEPQREVTPCLVNQESVGATAWACSALSR